MNSGPSTDQAVQLFITQVMYPTNQHTNLVLCAQLLSRVRLFATPWTIAHQVPLSMEFSRQTYWSGLPFPPPGESSPSRALVSCTAGGFFTNEPPGKPKFVKQAVLCALFPIFMLFLSWGLLCPFYFCFPLFFVRPAKHFPPCG